MEKQVRGIRRREKKKGEDETKSEDFLLHEFAPEVLVTKAWASCKPKALCNFNLPMTDQAQGFFPRWTEVAETTHGQQ
jgi:hypothetical protein